MKPFLFNPSDFFAITFISLENCRQMQPPPSRSFVERILLNHKLFKKHEDDRFGGTLKAICGITADTELGKYHRDTGDTTRPNFGTEKNQHIFVAHF